MMPQLVTKSSFDLMITFFFLAGFITLPAASLQAEDCLYTIYVHTSNVDDAGTDAVVTLVISDQAGPGSGLIIPNLAKWGNMGPGYDYFEKGNLDFFSGTSKCLPGPPCWMMLAQDDSGNKPGWYVDKVIVAMESSSDAFSVDQWLAKDEPPYQTATVRNNCGGASNIASIIPTPTTTLQQVIAEATDHDVAVRAARRTGSAGEQQNLPPAL